MVYMIKKRASNIDDEILIIFINNLFTLCNDFL